jgi:hypothetical protein
MPEGKQIQPKRTKNLLLSFIKILEKNGESATFLRVPKVLAGRLADRRDLLRPAAITFAVFGQTAHHDFVNFDDDAYVYDNPIVARGLTCKGTAWAFFFHAFNCLRVELKQDQARNSFPIPAGH